ncbi:uncharacterized protein METZ01_LOCUS515465, partial [marine metagenome]
MPKWIQSGSLKVAEELYLFINNEALPGLDISATKFWADFESIIEDLTPTNQELLSKREKLQSQIDEWHKTHRTELFDLASYRRFLTEIGYLVPEGEAYTVATKNVDEEISTLAGPQLVVPITNARYALNAANARWGSLYDALYGTDAIADEDGAERGAEYNPVRGEQV